MFRATMCPSSGETTVFMQHLVLVILCGWLVWRSISSCMTVWYVGAYAPAWLSGMEEHMLLHDCLVCRSICSCMTVWYVGAYAPAWLSGMLKHMLLHDCLVWRSICSCMTVRNAGAYAHAWLSGMQEHMPLHARQSSTQNNKHKVLHKHSYFSWWWAHSRPKHVEIDKYTKNKYTNKLWANVALFTRLYRDARSKKIK